MKVLLIQLPVPNNLTCNLPLASGYIKAMADSAKLPGVDIEILERSTQDRGGDAFLLDAILQKAPDLVGFSLYTWNSIRSKELAGALKQIAPEILLLGGGPEVNLDGDFILSDPTFDYLVIGEGEYTFLELLQYLVKGEPRLEQITGLGYRLAGSARLYQNAPRAALTDLNLIPSAYLGGTLDRRLTNFMSIELSRLCPSKCSFCYYGRQDLPAGGKRYFDLDRIKAELEYGRDRGVEQVHFIEANFNSLPHLEQLYRVIRQANPDRSMSFYTELRAEAMVKTEAQKLAKCNFRTVEVGLQSAVPEVLALVNRKNHLPRMVQGIKNLRELDIEVFLDVILGLPGDTPETFKRTLDFIEQNSIGPYDLFNLQILSGTGLKTQTLEGKFGLTWQKEPPYFVLGTASLSFEQLCRLRSETLKNKGDNPYDSSGFPQTSVFALALPDKSLETEADSAQPVERVILDLTHPVNYEKLSRQLASEVSIWFKNSTSEEIRKILAILSAPNPSGVWHIFLESPVPLEEKELTGIGKAVRHHTGYLDRLAVFALQQIDPEKFPLPPSIDIFNLVPWKPELTELAHKQIIWQVELSSDKTAGEWHFLLQEALKTPGNGVRMVSPHATPLEKLQEALADLELNNKHLWASDWKIAANLAGEETQPVYPYTFNDRNYFSVTSSAITRVQLRWAMSARQTTR